MCENDSKQLEEVTEERGERGYQLQYHMENIRFARKTRFIAHFETSRKNSSHNYVDLESKTFVGANVFMPTGREAAPHSTFSVGECFTNQHSSILKSSYSIRLKTFSHYEGFP